MTTCNIVCMWLGFLVSFDNELLQEYIALICHIMSPFYLLWGVDIFSIIFGLGESSKGRYLSRMTRGIPVIKWVRAFVTLQIMVHKP